MAEEFDFVVFVSFLEDFDFCWSWERGLAYSGILFICPSSRRGPTLCGNFIFCFGWKRGLTFLGVTQAHGCWLWVHAMAENWRSGSAASTLFLLFIVSGCRFLMSSSVLSFRITWLITLFDQVPTFELTRFLYSCYT